MRGGFGGRGAALTGFVMVAVLSLGGASARADVDDFGIETVSASRSTSQAGAHPDFTTSLTIKTDPATSPDPDGDRKPYASTRDVIIDLPPGMTGNPHAVESCSIVQFQTSLEGGGCSFASQVGIAVLRLYKSEAALYEPIYNLAAPGEANVARLGFFGYTIPVIIDVQMRSESDYGLTATAQGANAIFPLVTATTTLWGVPAAASHNNERFTPKEVLDIPGISESPIRSSGLAPAAFLSNPTACGTPQVVNFTVNSYQNPGTRISKTAELPKTTGCGLLGFNPGAAFAPTGAQADSPTGLEVGFDIDQTGLRQTTLTRPADLKKAVVTLPQGMSLNPASTGGLGGCSETQVGLVPGPGVHFSKAAPGCPGSSKIGTAEIVSPALEGPVQGSLYVARQNENPFDSLLAGYLVAQGAGATVKLAGRFDLDPVTGQITATFDNNPQQPFTDFRLHFKGGDRGVLVNPPQCGIYEIKTTLVPWSAADPENPTSSEVQESTDTFTVSSGPGGTPCPNPPAFTPSFGAGALTPLAGEFSPLSVMASRPDGSQTLTGIDIDLPPGLIAKLAGVPYCSNQAIQGAGAKSGLAELAAPSCPAASRVGSVDVAVGAGNSPYHVPGSAYLAGPYKGAPLSLVTITPSVAGPFDLGTVAVRAALFIDPETAKVRAVSDPLPTILKGIPLHLRSVVVTADRPNFSLNPTSCDPMRIGGTLIGSPSTKAVSERFQVGGCGALGFKPKLSLRLKGGTKRAKYPKLIAKLTARKGDANIGKASVVLPRSQFLAQEHIDTICTRVQFNANQCPKGAIYGFAEATTPLLDEPVRGPVYLRANGNERKLPDLVAALGGQIDINLVGYIDSVRGGQLRTRFVSVPDAPVTKFVLRMKGGKKSLLRNSQNVCKNRGRAVVKMTGQNGKIHDTQPRLGVRCGKKKR
jgi:hypothetical protein